jgi:hypothetical protein
MLSTLATSIGIFSLFSGTALSSALFCKSLEGLLDRNILLKIQAKKVKYYIKFQDWDKIKKHTHTEKILISLINTADQVNQVQNIHLIL